MSSHKKKKLREKSNAEIQSGRVLRTVGTGGKAAQVGKTSVDTTGRIYAARTGDISNRWTFPHKSGLSKASTIATKGGAAVGLASTTGVLVCDIMGHFMSENDVDLGKPIDKQIVDAILEIGEKRENYRRVVDKLISFYSTSKRVDLPDNYFYLTWEDNREKGIRELRDVANNIDKHHKNVNITTLATASVGTIAGTVTLATILAPVTFGTSYVIGALAVGAGAGLTALGASLTELGLTKTAFKTAQGYIDADQKITKELYNLIDEFSECEKELKVSMQKLDKWDTLEIVRTVFVCIGGAASIATSSISISRGATLFFSSGVYGVRGLVKEMALVPRAQWATRFGSCGRMYSAAKGIAKQAPSMASKGARVFGGVLTGVGMVLDVYTIVTTAIDVHNGSVSAAGDALRKTADALYDENIQVTELIENLKKQRQSEDEEENEDNSYWLDVCA